MSDINVGQVNATVGIKLPSFTNSNRPSSPDIGLMIYNTEESAIQIWDGNDWISAGGGGKIEATGGVITQSGGYKIHTFTASSFDTTLNSSFVVTNAPSNASVEVLVVAGGGGGGGNVYHGGGGGAGGLIYNSSFNISKQTYNVQVGRGGTGYAADSTPRSGVNSIFGTLTAIGGGAGGHGDATGFPGGSGGGHGVRFTSTAAAGTAGQGNAGGIGASPDAPYYGAGGGGGAGGVGANGTSSGGGAGGAGLAYNISGTSQFYAGGGGGSSYNNSNSGAGGSGIGGAGAYGPGGGNGAANTGSGGGGRDARGSENKGSGNGSAGIVIVKYIY